MLMMLNFLNAPTLNMKKKNVCVKCCWNLWYCMSAICWMLPIIVRAVVQVRTRTKWILHQWVLISRSILSYSAISDLDCTVKMKTFIRFLFFSYWSSLTEVYAMINVWCHLAPGKQSLSNICRHSSIDLLSWTDTSSWRLLLSRWI